MSESGSQRTTFPIRAKHCSANHDFRRIDVGSGGATSRFSFIKNDSRDFQNIKNSILVLIRGSGVFPFLLAFIAKNTFL